MRAVAVERLKGEPRLMEVPQPKPREDQLLVRVAFAGMNPFDWKVADGVMEGVMPHVLPLIIGGDASGTVAAMGAAVSRFAVGDRVFGQFVHAPLGEGTYAEFALVPETGAVIKTPEGIADDIAAALPTAAMTALSMSDALQLEPGAAVLIVGATGGVGLYTTQFVAQRGLRVLATAGGRERGRLMEFGAAEIFDHRRGELADQVSAAHPGGIGGLIDLVGDGAAFGRNLRLVRRGGYALSTIGAAVPADLQERGIHGGNFYLAASAALLERLAAAVLSGKLVVPIEATIGLEAAPAAIAAGRRGGARGKTLIRM